MIVKIFLFLLFLSILNIVKDIYAIYVAMSLREKLSLTTNRVVLLGISIAYVLTIIFTGLTI